MPFSTKIFSYPFDTADPCIVVEPDWWHSRELMEDPRFSNCSTSSSYRDFEAMLTIEEMRELHERYKPDVSSSIYSYSGWQEVIQPKLKQIEKILYSMPDKFASFRVFVFEWESGM